MSNPDDPRRRSPPRAEPLQPDAPGRGDKKQGGSGEAPQPGEQADISESARKNRQQVEDAVANNREGFGGG